MWSGDFASHTHTMTNPTTWQITKCHSPVKTEYPCYHPEYQIGQIGLRSGGKPNQTKLSIPGIRLDR